MMLLTTIFIEFVLGLLVLDRLTQSHHARTPCQTSIVETNEDCNIAFLGAWDICEKSW